MDVRGDLYEFDGDPVGVDLNRHTHALASTILG
ncbi:hypothetical protein Q672_20080 [Marinobacter sp. EVN1]|nr:hypothetical protein Q672_20080 [Marinobacter sp. EVN1]